MSPVPILTDGEPPVLAKSLSKVQSWDPDSPDSQGRKRHHLGIHGSVVAAEVGFPLLKWLLHTPDLSQYVTAVAVFSVLVKGPSDKASGLWGLVLVDAYEMLSCSTGFRSGPRQPGKDPWYNPGPPCHSLICCVILHYVTQVFCASVSWAQ